MNLDLDAVNRQWGRDPERLIAWALAQGPAILTSNFRPYSAVVLHQVTRQRPDIPVIWMDSGYNTPATYRYADELRRLLGLKLHVYQPRRTRERREALEGPPPASREDPRMEAFTREVKLEPFARALADFKPKVWIHGARAGDTDHRARMQPVSLGTEGLLKVAPLLHWSGKELHGYLQQQNLPNNWDYRDPTKPDPKQECGLLVVN